MPGVNAQRGSPGSARVTRDKVAVTVLVNHRHVEVRAGHHYLAMAP